MANNRQTMSKDAAEQAKVQAMRDIAKLPHNNKCADCDARDPDWTSINLGIFICIKCAGIHRNLGVHHSKVRSIELDTNCWDEDMINFMRSMGNERARLKFEARAPVFYVRPKEYDLNLVRERWIRAKYEKRMFVKPEESNSNGTTASDSSREMPAQSAAASAAASSAGAVAARANRPNGTIAGGTSPLSSNGSSRLNDRLAADVITDPATFIAPERALEGWLYKENKKLKWQKRWFLLWGRELHYFKDASDSYEAGRIDLLHVKIVIPDSSGSTAVQSAAAAAANSGGGAGSGGGPPPGHKFTFQLVSTEQDRAYPLAAESEEEMFTWVHAIRRAIIFYTTLAVGEEAKGMQSRVADTKIPFARLPPPTKKGTLQKQGGGWASWNKRYFVLAGDVLYYYKQQPADADLPEGGICLDGADVASGEDKLKRKCVFTVLTPDRSYFIQCTSEGEMRDWMSVLRRVTDKAQQRRLVDFADLNASKKGLVGQKSNSPQQQPKVTPAAAAATAAAAQPTPISVPAASSAVQSSTAAAAASPSTPAASAASTTTTTAASKSDENDDGDAPLPPRPAAGSHSSSATPPAPSAPADDSD